MTSIRDVHAELVTLIGGLSISQPVATSVKRVWKFTPPRSTALADIPCAILTYEQEPVVFRPALLMKPYTIHIQFFAGTMNEVDVSADIASSFLEELIQMLSDNQTLGGTVSVIREFRGNSPETLAVLPWADVSFVGLDLYLAVTITEAKEHAA